MGRAAAYAAAFIVLGVLIKDGTAQNLATDIGIFLRDTSKGLVPLSNVA